MTCREGPERLDSREHHNWARVRSQNQQGKYGVELGIEFVNKNKSHSWVRISHGLNKLVTDLINREYDDNEQETSTTKTDVLACASRSKAKAKPRRPYLPLLSSSTRTVPFCERSWTDIEPETYSPIALPSV